MILIQLIKGVFYKKFLLYIKASECADLTYYQRNQDVILNRAKDYYENDKESKQEINTETYLKKKIIKRENMEKNMSEEKKNIKKIIERQKSLRIIMNKIFFQL